MKKRWVSYFYLSNFETLGHSCHCIKKSMMENNCQMELSLKKSCAQRNSAIHWTSVHTVESIVVMCYNQQNNEPEANSYDHSASTYSYTLNQPVTPKRWCWYHTGPRAGQPPAACHEKKHCPFCLPSYPAMSGRMYRLKRRWPNYRRAPVWSWG